MVSWSGEDQIPVNATLKFTSGEGILSVLFPVSLISFPLTTPDQGKFIRDYSLWLIAELQVLAFITRNVWSRFAFNAFKRLVMFPKLITQA